MVVIKLVVMALFVGVGMRNINPANYTPFVPDERPPRMRVVSRWACRSRGARS
jgi:hypothetical protein